MDICINEYTCKLINIHVRIDNEFTDEEYTDEYINITYHSLLRLICCSLIVSCVQSKRRGIYHQSVQILLLSSSAWSFCLYSMPIRSSVNSVNYVSIVR